MDALGLDIGGTKIAGARVSPYGEVLAQASRPTTPDNPEGILDALAEIFHELGGKETLSAVGVAVAAFLNAERDSIFFSPNIAWQNFPLKAAVTERLGVP
ncbi:MAG: ROK family protein, partial [Pontimonas sp.]|nr:ROK family protein [Pontimonas sp.]